MNLNKLSLLTVSFNNNILTGLMVKSFMKQVGWPRDVIIVDNGTFMSLDAAFSKVFTVVDNRYQKITGEYNQCSKNHCSTIDYILKNKVNTEWVLLVDNDILFLPATAQYITAFNEFDYDAAGEIGWDDAPPVRLFPYFCLINVNKFRYEHLNYFDNNRCIGPGSQQYGKRGPNTLCWYKDTGCSFLEDIKDSWRIHQIKLSDYIVHMKCTGQNNKDYIGFLNKHHVLY